MNVNTSLQAGWKGTNCEINRNECEDYGQQCLNGAQCVDLIADFRYKPRVFYMAAKFIISAALCCACWELYSK